MGTVHLFPRLRDFDPRHDSWTRHELVAGERLTGVLLRRPSPGAFHGTRAFILTERGVVAIPATARDGHTVLERELRNIAVGTRVTVSYFGKRLTADGEREYRNYRVSVDGR